MNIQGQFSFEAGPTQDGYSVWLAGRRLAASKLARQIGLPLGQNVEVWLEGDIRLRGVLRLKENPLFLAEEQLRHLELVVDHTPFFYREMLSCVRLE